MLSGLFGRTNRAFPPVWLGLSVPPAGGDIDGLVSAALESRVPLDVSTFPALWGGKMRGTDAILSCSSSPAFENATDHQHAIDLTQAHLIETLSCVGRDYFDFYFLRIRRAVEEFQINGALEAIEIAKQEGHIRYLGIRCDGPALATLGMWQFHDAFDALMVPRSAEDSDVYDTLSPLAIERRVGILTSIGNATPDEIRRFAEKGPVQVAVNTAEEVATALGAIRG